MRRFTPLLLFALTALPLASAPTVEPAVQPIDADLVEEVKVRLVLLDVIAVDRRDRTVADLTRDDFEIVVGGEAGEIDTLDVRCEAGPSDDPRGTFKKNRKAPAAPLGGRKLVLAFDYLHLAGTARAKVLDHALRLVSEGGIAGDEVMVVALTGGLRIEQLFNRDADETLQTLKRMQYDISLWNGNFSHLTEKGWVESVEALLNVLGTMEGRKAVVLFSGMTDVPLDSQFTELAAAAATSRCSFYPVDANGLRLPGRPEGPG